MEEAFALTYTSPAITWPLEDMSPRERDWMLKRVTRAKKEERAEIEANQRKQIAAAKRGRGLV